jgi:hypothetical protein
MSTTSKPGAIVQGERVTACARGESRTVTGPLLPPDECDLPEIARIRVTSEDDPATGMQAKITVHRTTLQLIHPRGGSPRRVPSTG